MTVIDVHTHAFPDALAGRAMEKLTEGAGGIQPARDGTLASLLASMDRAGIDQAWVLSIATRPEQFSPILEWSLAIASERVVPFGSVHPEDPEAADHIHRLAAAGLRGIKLHPYYQQFSIDEPRVRPMLEAIAETGMVLLCHAGFDIAFGRDRIVDPARLARLLDTLPTLKLIAPHMGGWEDWDEVERHLIGRPVWLDTSFAVGHMPTERARAMLMTHPADRILFGTDSPWQDQARALAAVRRLDLPDDRLTALLGGNAQALMAEG